MTLNVIRLPAEIESILQRIERGEAVAADAEMLRNYLQENLALLWAFKLGDDEGEVEDGGRDPGG